MVSCEGWLLSKTGIGNGNYKYANSKEELDNWFLSKQINKFQEYSVIHSESPDKNHFNVGAVHVKIPHNECTNIDYLGWKNSDDNRIYWGVVLSRERVNENSTRLYFTIDYVASYFDTIEIGTCFVERDHSKLKPYENLLSEPISVNMVISSYSGGSDFREKVQNYFDDFGYTIVSTTSPDGKIEDPKMRYQAGGCIAGLMYTGDEVKCEEMFKKYLTTSRYPMATHNSFMTSIKEVYAIPNIILNDSSKKPYEYKDKIKTLTLDDINCKHAKTLNYITYYLAAQSGAIELNPMQYVNKKSSDIEITIRFTGGSGGKAVFIPTFFNEDSELQPNYTNYVTSATWPSIAVAGFDKETKFKFNDFSNISTPSDIKKYNTNMYSL